MCTNLFYIWLTYSRERGATCINEYPRVERFMYLFMCVLQWISIYEIHFGSRGYSFGMTIIFFPHPSSPNSNLLLFLILLQKKEGDGKEKLLFRKKRHFSSPVNRLHISITACIRSYFIFVASENCVSSVHFALRIAAIQSFGASCASTFPVAN